ncbi:MAG: hypothetical protein SangKO_021330 [Sandaracinaceae bacterium]
MGFRDQVVAERAQREGLLAELAGLRARAEAAEAENAQLREELDGALQGASEEARLRGDAWFGIGQILLPITGLLGVVLAVLVWINGMEGAFYGHLDLSVAGLGRFLEQLDEWATVLAAAAFLISLGLTVASPVAALGVLRRRKWGWHLAVLTFLVWTLAWPPVGLLGLYAFCRRPVRRAFLGLAWHEVD